MYVCLPFCIDDRIIYTVLDPLFNLMMYHRTITTAYILFHIHEIKLCTLVFMLTLSIMPNFKVLIKC